MVRMGFLANATPQDLIQWITEQTQTTAAAKTGANTFIPDTVQECVLPPMNQMALQVSGTLKSGESMSTQPVVSAYFALTPVGRGQTSEVIVTSEAAALRPYLVEIFRRLGEKWPLAQTTLWLDKPSQSETPLSELQLLTDFENFQIELENFTRAYTSETIRHVNVNARRDPFVRQGALVDRKMQPTDPNRLRSWEVQLGLKTTPSPYKMTTELSLDIEISRMGGRYPVLLKITEMSGYAHRESVAFAEDFGQHCKKTWEWASTTPEPQPMEERPASQPEVPENIAASPVTPEPHPWEKIPDIAWDREALRLWWEGHTHKEIGQKIHVAEKTVLNRLSGLRKTYGEDIVITERERRKRWGPGKG